MAFDYFASQNVDFAVIETGLGGRLDSTNLCNPIISIITNIGIDHIAFLGDTVEEIAIEKAGIIKSGTQVIIGKHQIKTDDVFISKADECKSPLAFAEDVLELRSFESEDDNFQTYDVWYNNLPYIDNLKSPLRGNYQKENICTAMASIELLREIAIPEINKEHIVSGVENVIGNTGFYGRWQTIDRNPLVICDTGHNIDGIKAIVRQLSEIKFNNLHFVLGMVSDKDI